MLPHVWRSFTSFSLHFIHELPGLYISKMLLQSLWTHNLLNNLHSCLSAQDTKWNLVKICKRKNEPFESMMVGCHDWLKEADELEQFWKNPSRGKVVGICIYITENLSYVSQLTSLVIPYSHNKPHLKHRKNN